MVRLKRLFDSTMSATWCRLQPSARCPAPPLPRPQQQTIGNAIKSYSKVQKLVKHFANSLPVRRTGAASVPLPLPSHSPHFCLAWLSSVSQVILFHFFLPSLFSAIAVRGGQVLYYLFKFPFKPMRKSFH